MTRWVIVREDENRAAWSVQKIGADGSVSYPRPRWRGISCIDAQVIAAELENAYLDGYRQGRDDVREVFAEVLGD